MRSECGTTACDGCKDGVCTRDKGKLRCSCWITPPEPAPKQSTLGKALADIARLDLKSLSQIGKRNTTFKAFSWRGHFKTDVRTLIGYDELLAFIREETDDHNAIQFSVWIDPQ